MKTFDDLVFKDHSLKNYGEICEHAVMNFPNGFGVSVLFGDKFYSNTSLDTYELGMLKDDRLVYDIITNGNVLGYLTRKEVTEIMKKIQKLPFDYEGYKKF